MQRKKEIEIEIDRLFTTNNLVNPNQKIFSRI